MGIPRRQLPPEVQALLRGAARVVGLPGRPGQLRPAPGGQPTGRRMAGGYRSKLEGRFAQHLQEMQLAGEVVWWQYEPLTLRLGNVGARCGYTPDFIVTATTHPVRAYEVKGFWRDGSREKVKVAARLFPWMQFVGVEWDRENRCWDYEDFSP